MTDAEQALIKITLKVGETMLDLAERDPDAETAFIELSKMVLEISMICSAALNPDGALRTVSAGDQAMAAIEEVGVAWANGATDEEMNAIINKVMPPR